jgi:hypothetical protein
MRLSVLLGAIAPLIMSMLPLLARPAIAEQPKKKPIPLGTAVWIDADILRQLQAIEPIDRTKLKPFVVNAIAALTSKRLFDATVTQATGSVNAPEVAEWENMPTIKVSGKLRQQTLSGKQYSPQGSQADYLFALDGRLLRVSAEVPPLPPKLKDIR